MYFLYLSHLIAMFFHKEHYNNWPLAGRLFLTYDSVDNYDRIPIFVIHNMKIIIYNPSYSIFSEMK